jgi:hypothetical protein
MSRLSRDFDPVEPTTKRWFYIDFGPELASLPANEIIQVASFTCSVVRGVDPAPQSHVLSQVAIVGSAIGAFCGNFLPGVTYSLEATASTSAGNILPNNARLYCQGPNDL